MTTEAQWNLHRDGPWKLLVSGGRNYSNARKVQEVLKRAHEAHPNLFLIEGEASGLDTLARKKADDMGIPVARVPANWTVYRKKAGPIRNRWMLALDPHYLIAFHTNIEESSGTSDMIQTAKNIGLPFTLVEE